MNKQTATGESFELKQIAAESAGYSESVRLSSPLAYHCHFSGLGDMVRVATAGASRGDLYDFRDVFFSDPDWVGRKFYNFEDVVRACDSTWKEGVDRVEEMARELERETLPRPTVIRRRRVWDDYAGDEIDVDRYRSADPFFRTNARKPSSGPRLITLLCQIGQNAGMTSEKLFWRGALAVALARLVEDAGYRTEIVAFEMGKRCIENRQCSSLMTSLSLKSAGDPLEVGSLVNATSGWFFRTVVFASFTAAGEKLSYGLGSNCEATEKTVEYLAPNARPWLVSAVYDKDSALALARKLLATLVNEREGAL